MYGGCDLQTLGLSLWKLGESAYEPRRERERERERGEIS